MATIIVIGAGIAGLKAALDLALVGHRVIILEARSRLGGRIYTSVGLDQTTPVELGASYWEGKPNNPLFQQYFSIVGKERHKVRTVVLSLVDSQLFSIEATKNNILPNIVKTYYQAQQWLQTLPQYATGKTCQEFLNELFSMPLQPYTNLYWIKKWMEYDLRHHTTPLTLRSFKSFQVLPDESCLEAWHDTEANFCFIKGGYYNLIEQISQECLNAGVTILLNQEVVYIQDNQQQGVQIKTTSSQFSADKIISTIPVGVLKKVASKIFSPGLSSLKLQAIAALGVHEATRVIVEFPEPFWDNANAPYIYLESPYTPGLKEFRLNFPLHGKTILQTDSYADIAKTLLDKKNHQKAHQLLLDYIMQDLRKAYPQAPSPIYYLIHHWSNDPFALGAYPYRTIRMTEEVQQALERSEGNIYFAGADISRYGFSVHNAYASGKRTAALLAAAL